jgi:predicted hotdog family 3-hydroxylacyl-ACP dehydratase
MGEMFPPAAELLPHAGRAVLIDKVLEDTQDSIRVSAHVTTGNPYFVPGLGLPVWVGIELMAQAIAAHAGLAARREQRPPRAGMLLGTRRFEANAAYFPAGCELEVLAQRDFGDDGGLAACACTILGAGQILARATIIIVEIGKENVE